MADDSPRIEISMSEIRAVTGYAVACARPALAIFEAARPGDRRPRAAIAASQMFAEGARRTQAIRDSATAAFRAAEVARDAGQAAASDAARAAATTAGAVYLHARADAAELHRILGSAAHAAMAFELAVGDPAVGAKRIEGARMLASPTVVNVLKRYPPAPEDGGRCGELIRQLDASLR